MRPNSREVVERCEVQTKRLFELFLQVDADSQNVSPKYQDREMDEGMKSSIFYDFFFFLIIFCNKSKI